MPFSFRRTYEEYRHRGAITVPPRDRIKGIACMARYAARLAARKPALFVKVSIAKRQLSTRRFRSVTLVVDYGCNLACAHCNVSKLRRPTQATMTDRDYRDLDRVLERDHGTLGYALTGGEPLMHEKLYSILEAVHAKDRFILINTNGTLVDDRMAARLAAAHVDVLNVSIDEMHARATRRDGIDFDGLARLCARIRRHGMTPQYNCVVTMENLQSGLFDRIVNFCLDREVLLIGNLPIPLGSWFRNLDILLPSDISRYLRHVERHTPYYRTDHKSNIHQYGCPAFHEKLYLTPEGDVLGCTFLQFTIGNVLREPLGDILARVERMPYFRGYPPTCPPAEDLAFVQGYLDALEGAKTLPIDRVPQDAPDAPWRPLERP